MELMNKLILQMVLIYVWLMIQFFPFAEKLSTTMDKSSCENADLKDRYMSQISERKVPKVLNYPIKEAEK